MKKILATLLAILMITSLVIETTVLAIPSVVDVGDSDSVLMPTTDDELAELDALLKYTVYFDANGGTNAPLSQIKTEYKNMVIKSNMPSRDGYTFAGWATSPYAQTAEYVPGGMYSKDEDITLYAVWSDKYNGFDSIAANYQIVATPHMCIGGYDATYDENYEIITLELCDNQDLRGFAPAILNLTPDLLGNSY